MRSYFSNLFISGGEEKIFRSFEAPSAFVQRFAQISGLDPKEMTEVRMFVKLLLNYYKYVLVHSL